jgi:hypothetical protein
MLVVLLIAAGVLALSGGGAGGTKAPRASADPAPPPPPAPAPSSPSTPAGTSDLDALTTGIEAGRDVAIALIDAFGRSAPAPSKKA